MQQGAEKAREIGDQTMKEVRSKTGLRYWV
jgi:hypothetical protein